MIAAFDVHYFSDGKASAAAVLFADYRGATAFLARSIVVETAFGYVPGQFYRRELPCILRLLDEFSEVPKEIIVDGYVMLADRPGLGWHLFESLGRNAAVIGMAKSKYRGSTGIEVLRGKSMRPLYITSAGMDPMEAAERIRSMHGPARIPTLLKYVDSLARGGG
jgi:deoxyribonuclease V